MVNAPPLLINEEKATYHPDQDGLWKQIITDMFEPFMLFFAPNLYEKLDWCTLPTSLEQELHGAYPCKKGKKYTDKLLKVHLKNGKEQWILVHIEVQGSGETTLLNGCFSIFTASLIDTGKRFIPLRFLPTPNSHLSLQHTSINFTEPI